MSSTQLATFPAIQRGELTTLQFNMGRLCNQACLHCHVDSSPARSGAEDNAAKNLCEQIVELIRGNPQVLTLDLTGGAPELNPNFRWMVEKTRELDRKVFVRHNITVQSEPGQSDLPEFFAKNNVELFCSLPCYLEDNVDAQRGQGVFAQSIVGLRRLNQVGFGTGTYTLNLVYNPIGNSLPAPSAELEPAYKTELRERFDLHFDRLLCITNQPIHRFKSALHRLGKLNGYEQLLRENFNSSTLDNLMCRSAISIRWDGKIFDCDFNLVQNLEIPNLELKDLFAQDLSGNPIGTAEHCFACTAGCGSSCGGELV
ncbi:MAG TPA: arsenosugar biosynthesis radical SAM (seleno)protein ArsS [Planctomycetota bacterium]|jgi:radical SAM/Cys-rich protein|nr:radical SAM protein [Planctomycetota bacterium]MDP7559223.1 arsenosugar biosynthesis radical SAM protein ArsS [Planctomycetota bacterium]HJM39091.1 arsenosugar biosynthesis radical SAM (seleno)protein ArsS [Planctomycetota bacterium]|tara:strand:+ start:5770 stop:6711 length:942 start_codon:yes stop_codon:yes gene_type:complete